MIYLDTSALVKLVFEEAESTALLDWVEQRTELPKLTSAVAAIELVRTCRRLAAAAVPAARLLLRGLDLIPLSEEVAEAAALCDPAELRTLDAIHLSSALALGDGVSAFVAYDRKLGAAARDAGLAVVSPG
ncbi:MAG: type II toxin-antitoxin system VapC family toxin [Acidimicrobiales bacterium]